MLFQLRDLVFTILEETIRKCFRAIHIFDRCCIFGLYSKCLNKTIWERFFLEGSHVHCTHIRAFKKWIVVCQKEKDKRIPSWHITVDLMRYVCSRLFMSISFSPKSKLKQRSCSQNNLSKSVPLLMKALSSVSFVLSCCSSLGYQCLYSLTADLFKALMELIHFKGTQVRALGFNVLLQ